MPKENLKKGLSLFQVAWTGRRDELPDGGVLQGDREGAQLHEGSRAAARNAADALRAHRRSRARARMHPYRTLRPPAAHAPGRHLPRLLRAALRRDAQPQASARRRLRRADRHAAHWRVLHPRARRPPPHRAGSRQEIPERRDKDPRERQRRHHARARGGQDRRGDRRRGTPRARHRGHPALSRADGTPGKRGAPAKRRHRQARHRGTTLRGRPLPSRHMPVRSEPTGRRHGYHRERAVWQVRVQADRSRELAQHGHAAGAGPERNRRLHLPPQPARRHYEQASAPRAPAL